MNTTQPSLNAQAQLSLRYADKVMAARNPAQQAALSQQVTGIQRTAADDAVDWGNGYRVGYDNLEILLALTEFSLSYQLGYAQGKQDRQGQLQQDTTGSGVVGKRL